MDISCFNFPVIFFQTNLNYFCIWRDLADWESVMKQFVVNRLHCQQSCGSNICWYDSLKFSTFLNEVSYSSPALPPRVAVSPAHFWIRDPPSLIWLGISRWWVFFRLLCKCCFDFIITYFMSSVPKDMYCYRLKISFSSDWAENFFLHVFDP